jgi:hypothetical protein
VPPQAAKTRSRAGARHSRMARPRAREPKRPVLGEVGVWEEIGDMACSLKLHTGEGHA